MKKIITSYNFIAAEKKVILNEYTSINLIGLLLITNVTDNIIIYNFADATKGGAAGGNTITLTYDTSSMSNGDSLQIFYDDRVEEKNTLGDQIEDLTDEIRKLRTLMELNSGNSL